MLLASFIAIVTLCMGHHTGVESNVTGCLLLPGVEQSRILFACSRSFMILVGRMTTGMIHTAHWEQLTQRAFVVCCSTSLMSILSFCTTLARGTHMAV